MHGPAPLQLSNGIARGLDKQLQQIYNDIANDPALVIHKDIFNYTRSQLHQGINQVFGSPKFNDPEFDLVMKLRQNADRFAGYKSAWQTAHIRNVEPGQMPAINSNYNVNWMRTEYVHTVRSARAAKNWQAIEQDKDLYPFLEYMPSTAAEPRNEHQRLYGVIKPVDDPFWDTWMPPSDWGCRCSVKQVRNNEGAKQPPNDIKLPPATMRNNPGKSGQIFTDQHPMIKKVGPGHKQAIDKVVDTLVYRTAVSEVAESVKNLIGTKIAMEADDQILNVSIVKNSIEKNLRRDKWFNKRHYIVKNLKKAVENVRYNGYKVFNKEDFTKDEWEKVRRIKKFHFFKSNLDGIQFQVDVVERYDKQIYLYNIMIIEQ